MKFYTALALSLCLVWVPSAVAYDGVLEIARQLKRSADQSEKQTALLERIVGVMEAGHYDSQTYVASYTAEQHENQIVLPELVDESSDRVTLAAVTDDCPSMTFFCDANQLKNCECVPQSPEEAVQDLYRTVTT